METLLNIFFNLEIMKKVWPFLLQGMWMTIVLSLVVIPLGLFGGLMIAVLSSLQRRWLNRLLIVYVDFFRAANSGHYVLFFLALSKIFDRDQRVAGISELKRALRAEGKTKIAIEIARQLNPVEQYVKRVMSIRNRSVVHNEHAIPRNKVYEVNGITPNQLREVIDAACGSINATARALGIANTVFESDRAERATLNLLAALGRARARA